MGWYRQIQRQCGIKNNSTTRAGTVLWFLFPCLLLPTLLASGVPPAVFLPPLGWVAGHLCEPVGLPPTPAMILLGVAFRAAGLFELTFYWRRVAYMTRYIAVAVVLLKGGLALNHLPNLPLALVPCTLEATAVAVLSVYLMEFTWPWGYVFGFAVSAASSSVNAEKLAELKAGGYGAKEFYRLILPTSTIENIYSITAFTTTLTMALTGEADWWVYVIRGPAAIFSGILFAVCWGFVIALFPHKEDENVISKRSVLALLGACMVYLGAKEYGIAPGGPLGTLATGAVASFFWRAQGWGDGKNPVLGVVSVCWNILEPALFCLVGAELDVYGTSLRELLVACIIMLASMVVRLVACYIFMAIRREYSFAEIIFTILVWTPKATVLAALTPQPLDNVRKTRGNPLEETSDEFRMCNIILLAAIVEMVVTAPIGYVLMNAIGKKLLPKTKQDKDKDIKESLTAADKV